MTAPPRPGAAPVAEAPSVAEAASPPARTDRPERPLGGRNPADPDLVPTDELLRNPSSPGRGICPLCRLFISPARDLCHSCASQPNHLDAIVPISYSPRGGPLHAALRDYKWSQLLGPGNVAIVRVAGILWRFLDHHLACVAATAGVDRFDLVTVVPSSNPDRDRRHRNLRAIAAWCAPIRDRYRRLLTSTGRGRWGRAYDPDRYEPLHNLDGRHVLLIDDSWVTGGHAQSAAHALRSASAATVALVVVGRYLRAQWPAGDGLTCGDRLANPPAPFDWTRCSAPTGRLTCAESRDELRIVRSAGPLDNRGSL